MHTLITGTSRGIGFHLTEAALTEGQTVFAVTRSPSALQHLKLKFKDQLVILDADITTQEGRDFVVKNLNTYGKLDTLINNAGVFKRGDSQKDFEESFHLNALVPYFLTKTLLPFLNKSKEPRVVQISTMMSSLADNLSGGHYAYRSSKAALNMITRSLAIDVPTVRFGLIHPGWVKTEMGGAEAPVQPEDSAAGIWKVIHSLELSSKLKLQDFRGKEIFW